MLDWNRDSPPSYHPNSSVALFLRFSFAEYLCSGFWRGSGLYPCETGAHVCLLLMFLWTNKACCARSFATFKDENTHFWAAPQSMVVKNQQELYSQASCWSGIHILTRFATETETIPFLHPTRQPWANWLGLSNNLLQNDIECQHKRNHISQWGKLMLVVWNNLQCWCNKMLCLLPVLAVCLCEISFHLHQPEKASTIRISDSSLGDTTVSQRRDNNINESQCHSTHMTPVGVDTPSSDLDEHRHLACGCSSSNFGCPLKTWAGSKTPRRKRKLWHRPNAKSSTFSWLWCRVWNTGLVLLFRTGFLVFVCAAQQDWST